MFLSLSVYFVYGLKRLFRFVKYGSERKRFFRELKIKRIQDHILQKEYDRNETHLIVFFVPGADRETGLETISGGVISLVSLCEETKKLREVHHAQTLMCIFPRDFLFLKHLNFENETALFRFGQLPAYFNGVKKLTLHLPELLVPYFDQVLLPFEKAWIKSIPDVHLNVINANILLMPPPDQINQLEQFTRNITITAAHSKYCNLQNRLLFNRPLHKFSAWISPEQYIFRSFEEKENIMVVSPDGNEYRNKIIDLLKTVQGLEIITLQHLTYARFKEVIAKAKWALTFGEGLDGYILEPIFSGAFGMAVYNEDFFTEDFKNMPGVYSSYELLAAQITADIAALNQRNLFAEAQAAQYELCSRYYNYSHYQDNIRKFYLGDYTFK